MSESAIRNVVDAPAVNPTRASLSWKWVAGEVLRKLAPQVQWKNPVMFVVYLGSIITTVLWLDALRGGRPDAPAGFIFAITVWLWFTVLFANVAEALAEGRGKAQADALRAARRRVLANVLSEPNRDAESRSCASDELRAGMFLLRTRRPKDGRSSFLPSSGSTFAAVICRARSPSLSVRGPG